ncbi:hypothetical protein [Siccirubricoccus phaeus]|uniref:hypothetical protein n=1 Tax=Siccirubricoccus phaeus TaxID=2595053 RepID=UPI0011F29669|nr:hypothetical protein [Siccirubricoccus phaeus]
MTLIGTACYAPAAQGRRLLAGAAGCIADELPAWPEAERGFNLICNDPPGSLQGFAEMAMPALPWRGLFRPAYQGRGLRGDPGLRVPPSRRRMTA